MGDMFAQASTWLELIRSENMTQAILYTRGDIQTSINASLGRSVFSTEDAQGIALTVQTQDFIVAASDINGKPQRKDKIQYNGSIYEVLDQVGIPVYRINNYNADTYRIHTKKVGEV